MIYLGITILQSIPSVGGFTWEQVTVVVGIVVAVRIAEYAWVHWVSPTPQKNNTPIPKNENGVPSTVISPTPYPPIQSEIITENKVVEKPMENSARVVVAQVFAPPAKNSSATKKISIKKKVKKRTVSAQSTNPKPLPKEKRVEEKMKIKKEAEPKPKAVEMKPIPVEVKKETVQTPSQKVEIKPAKKMIMPKKIALAPIAITPVEKKQIEKKVPAQSAVKVIQKKSV
ncbi:MAG: hypothetical protein Q7K34_01500, partial [archaeon]|nr:hypothetical protein [archaeon]